MQRRESAKLSGDLSSATDMMSFRVIDPPIVPQTPVGPNRMRFYSLVFVSALMAGLGVAFLMSQIRPTFLSQHSLREVTGVPILGSIGMNWTEQQKSSRRRRLYGFGLAVASLFTAFAGVITVTLLRAA